LTHHNLFKYFDILKLGLGFVPQKNEFCEKILATESDKLYRNLKIREFFSRPKRQSKSSSLNRIPPPSPLPPPPPLTLSNQARKKFIPKSSWCPPGRFPQARKTIAKIKSTIWKKRNEKIFGNNFSTKQRKGLSELRKRTDIIIKKADKGSNIVIMNKYDYTQEAMRQLSNNKYYTPLDKPLYLDNCKEITNLLETLRYRKFINKKQFEFLSPAKEPRQRLFYLLPKIHKDRKKWPSVNMPPGRPIVSDVGSEAYEVSGYIDSFLQPLAQNHFAYLRNSYQFVNELKNLQIPKSAILVTADIESLYTNIDTTFGLSRVRDVFARNPDVSRCDEIILKLLEICLTKNDFEFNGQTFLQIQGTAMGKRFAPSYANIALFEFDRLVTNYRIPVLNYRRFIDDIFFLWLESRAELETFKVYLNGLFPFLKLTFCDSIDRVSFLDVEVKKYNDSLITKVFFKETDTHLLLHKNSAHPKHTFKGIIKSQIIRFKRLCSRATDFDEACDTLFNALLARGYERKFLNKIKRTVVDGTGPLANSTRPLANRSKETNPNLLVVSLPFSAKYLDIGQEWIRILRDSYTEERIKPLLAFRKGRSLASSLISAKIKN
jgi:hypothetical protein